MKVTGHKLKDAIKRWTLRRDTVGELFGQNLWFFEGEADQENKPKNLMAKFTSADAAIARLQVAQVDYNLKVPVNVGEDGQLTLCEAVKRVGGIGREEKMWRSAISDKSNQYGDRTIRSKDVERATKAVSTSEAVAFATTAAKRASCYRAAIATGNNSEIELNIDPKLFD